MITCKCCQSFRPFAHLRSHTVLCVQRYLHGQQKSKVCGSTHNQKKPNVLLGQISTCNCIFIYNKPIWNSFTIQKILCWLDVVVSIGRSPNTNFILAGDVSRDGCVRTKVPSGSFGYRMRGSPNKTRQFGLRFFFDGNHVKKVKIGILIFRIPLFWSACWSMNLDWNREWGRVFHIWGVPSFQDHCQDAPYMLKEEAKHIHQRNTIKISWSWSEPPWMFQTVLLSTCFTRIICLFQEVWGLFKNTPQRDKTPHLCWTPVVIQDSSKVNLMRVKI